MALDPFTQSVYGEAWSLIQDAAAINPDTGRASYTPTDVAAAAGELFARASGAEAFAYRAALNSLYGMAVRANYAAQTLTTADLTAGIDSSMIGEWPTAAPLTMQVTQPQYMSKMEFTYQTVLGTTETGWVTVTGITELPGQVGTLQSMLIGKALTSYTVPQSQGGTPLPGNVLASFGEVTSMQLYSV